MTGRPITEDEGEELTHVDRERWELVKPLFEAAVGQDTASRAAFLDAACAGDPELRRELESLLRADAEAPESFLAVPFDPAQLPVTARSSPTDGSEAPTPGGSRAVAPRFAAGTLVKERFRVLRLIARGGMGEVYEVEDLSLRDRVALKTIQPHGAADRVMLKRFKREISLARRITHPNVCRVFELFEHHEPTGAPLTYFTMELLAGETLHGYLARRGRLPPDEALPVVQQIADGLDAAHRQGVVHRDLKASNVHLVPGPAGFRAVITDFGLARGGTDEVEHESGLTTQWRVVGTPAYMAPELLRGERPTEAADIYAFGVLLYLTVTGELPFPPPGRTEAHGAWPGVLPLSPLVHVPDLPPLWEKVILRCLDPDPAGRFPGAGQAVAALGDPAIEEALGHGVMGPYRLLAPQPLEGLEEAYAAVDDRSSRPVAVAVLPPGDGRCRDLESRSRILARVGEPGIARFALEQHGGRRLLVADRPPGQSLAEIRQAGGLEPERLLAVAEALSRVVGAAHEQQLVHGALAPSRVVIDEAGTLHVLGYGLDSLRAGDASAKAEPWRAPEASPDRAPGAAEDIYSVGAMLLWLATGEPPPAGDARKPAPAEALSRRLPDLSPHLGRLIGRCLHPDPRQRLRSASDVASSLRDLREDLRARRSAVRRARSRRRWLAALAVSLLGVATWWVAGLHRPRPAFKRLTFQRGIVEEARFGPHGDSVYYSARWDGAPPAIFTLRLSAPEPLGLGIGDATLLAVGASDLAVLLRPRQLLDGYTYAGTMALVSPSGGPARPVRERVSAADHTGTEAAARGLERLEFPAGRDAGPARDVLYLRLSRDGRKLALNRGHGLEVLEAGGRTRKVASVPGGASGLAWGPGGDSLWVSRYDTAHGSRLVAYGLRGKERLLFRGPGRLRLLDVRPDGAALVASETFRREVLGGERGSASQRVLTWLADTGPVALSSDGHRLLLHEYSTRSMFGVLDEDQSEPMRLGTGGVMAFLPGEQAVLVLEDTRGCQLAEVPIGPGPTRRVSIPELDCRRAEPLPSGGYLLQVSKGGGESAIYRAEAGGADPRPVTPDGWTFPCMRNLSPDGRTVLVQRVTDERAEYRLFSLDGGASEPLPSLPADAVPQGWAADGRHIFALSREGRPAQVWRMDVETGVVTPWLALAPVDPAGVTGVQEVVLNGDGTRYAYSFFRTQSDLYLVTGLR